MTIPAKNVNPNLQKSAPIQNPSNNGIYAIMGKNPLKKQSLEASDCTKLMISPVLNCLFVAFDILSCFL